MKTIKLKTYDKDKNPFETGKIQITDKLYEHLIKLNNKHEIILIDE